MKPFCDPVAVVGGLKERIESLSVHGTKCFLIASHSQMPRAHRALGERLFLGTASGNLQIYNLDQDEDGNSKACHVTTKSLGKRPIEQVGYIKDINSVVSLAGPF